MNQDEADYLYQFIGYMLAQRKSNGTFPFEVPADSGYEHLGDYGDGVSAYLNQRAMLVLELGNVGQWFALYIYGNRVEEYTEVALRVAGAFDDNARCVLRSGDVMGSQIEFQLDGQEFAIMVRHNKMPIQSSPDEPHPPGTKLWIADGTNDQVKIVARMPYGPF